jgi:4-diphosphocytidyl-2C-methyl-D-erythritol kinase
MRRRKRKQKDMTLPHIDTTITRGNILTVLVNLVIVVTFLVTDHVTVQNHGKEISSIQAERRENLAEIRTAITLSTKRIQQLEDWKDIGPRFTPTDAALLKTQTIQESQRYAVEQINGLKMEFAETKKAIMELTLAVNTQSVLLKQHMGTGKD